MRYASRKSSVAGWLSIWGLVLQFGALTACSDDTSIVTPQLTVGDGSGGGNPSEDLAAPDAAIDVEDAQGADLATEDAQVDAAADDATVADAGPEDAQADAASPDVAGPDADQPDAALDTLAPDTIAPDAAEPDVVQPDAADPDAAGPDAAGQDTVQPDTAGPDTLQPDTAEPDTVQPDTVAPDADQPDTAAPDAAQPDTAGPDAVESDTVADAGTADDAAGTTDATTTDGGITPDGQSPSDADGDVQDGGAGGPGCTFAGQCNDYNPCTADQCLPDGQCLWTIQAGPCDDGNPCTVGDKCEFVKCSPGAVGDGATLCNDGNVCTADSCDVAAKACVYTPVAGPCSDGDVCTATDKCADGKCAVGAANDSCADGSPCTTDVCDPKTGACSWVALAGPCEDGNACTSGDTCKDAKCESGGPKACPDGGACSVVQCDAKSGQCVASPKAGAEPPACDGKVVGGRCIRAFKQNAAFAAAEQACVAWGGHLASPASLAENDAARTAANEVCGAGSQAFLGGSDAAVEGKWTWTDGTAWSYTNWGNGQPDNYLPGCNPYGVGEDALHLFADGKWNDICAQTTLPCYVCARPAPTLPCSNPALCQTGGVCAAGQCVGLSTGCDDANPCTTDACQAGGACLSTVVADGTACGVGGVCKTGTCIPPGIDASAPALSCQAILATQATAKSGLWWIDPDGNGAAATAQQTWCDFTLSGGGWTLVAVVSDDGQANFTWNNKALWSTDAKLVGSAQALTKDYKSPLLQTLPGKELLFAHSSGVWAQYPLGNGATSLGQVVTATAGPKCYALTGAGVAMTAGTLTKTGKLCDTKLYINAADHDGQNSCFSDNQPEHTWGPAWNVNRDQGCFDDPGWAGSLGPVQSEPNLEGGTTNAHPVGFGFAIGKNTGAVQTGANWMRVYVR